MRTDNTTGVAISRILDNEYSNIKNGYENLLESTFNLLKYKLITRYGYLLEVRDEYRLNVVNKYLSTIDKNFNKRTKSDDGLLCNTQMCIPVDKNTFVFVIAGNPMIGSNNIRYILMNSDRYAYNLIKIYFFGRFAAKYYNDLKSKISARNTQGLKIFNVSATKDEDSKENFQSIIYDLGSRSIDTLFYENDIKESIVKHIDWFFKSRHIFEEKNIGYKTSMLLYGEPGTGKSSLVKALCTKYNIDMVLVDMTTFEDLDLNILTQCIDGDDKTYLILLEDIDTLFDLDRETKDITKDDRKVINKLLQFLDSNSSPNNVIFVCTTNHVDKLDSAIMRRGRLDKKFLIGPLNKDKAREMCESFNIDKEYIDNILSRYDNNDKINQSFLQGEILEAVKMMAMKEGENDDESFS